VKQASLPNGLRICAIEMPGVRHVSIRLIVGAGSRDDPREKAGISHFVEHLLFRGTERHPHESALRAHVASMGATMNAHTTKESTTLEIDVSARHVRSALRLIAEVLLTPTFNGLEVERRFPCAGYGPVGIAGVLTMFVLGTNGAGRLHDVLRSRTGIAYAGDADITLYADAGKLTVHSDVKKEKLPQLVEAVSKTLRDLRDRGPSPEELHAAKESYCFLLEAMLGTPASAAQAEGLALATNEPSLDEEIELTRAATAAEVRDRCRTTLRANSAQIVVNGPREEDDLKSAWRSFETALGE
jgi:predicted Zn-dependent peptidase